VALSHFGIFLLTDYILRRTGISVDWTVFSSRELVLVFGVGVLGAVAGVLPAWKGARVPVAENLGLTS
jgi:ABC-type antimicrobial peptide transport system permease subunit